MCRVNMVYFMKIRHTILQHNPTNYFATQSHTSYYIYTFLSIMYKLLYAISKNSYLWFISQTCTAAFTFSLLSNLFSRSASFMGPNKCKSDGARSGLYGVWGKSPLIKDFQRIKMSPYVSWNLGIVMPFHVQVLLILILFVVNS